jgi:hypothetical protein
LGQMEMKCIFNIRKKFSILAKVTQASDVAHGPLVQLYDGRQLLLVEEITQIHYTIHLGRDHRPSASKLTNFLTQSHRSEQDLK